jgi:hypothetical protein
MAALTERGLRNKLRHISEIDLRSISRGGQTKSRNPLHEGQKKYICVISGTSEFIK